MCMLGSLSPSWVGSGCSVCTPACVRWALELTCHLQPAWPAFAGGFGGCRYTRSVYENATVGAGFTPCVVATDPDLDPLTFSIVSTVTYTGLVNITSAGTCCALASWGWVWGGWRSVGHNNDGFS